VRVHVDGLLLSSNGNVHVLHRHHLACSGASSRASVSKNDVCVCVCVCVCVIVVELGKKKENKPSAARSWQQKKFTSAEELDTNSVIVVELGNEPFLFIEAL
jgi:hypothetical protein